MGLEITRLKSKENQKNAVLLFNLEGLVLPRPDAKPSFT